MKTSLVSGYIVLSLFAYKSQASQMRNCNAINIDDTSESIPIEVKINEETPSTRIHFGSPWLQENDFEVVYGNFQQNGNPIYVGVSDNKRKMVVIDWQNQEETFGEMKVGSRMSPIPFLGKYSSFTLYCN